MGHVFQAECWERNIAMGIIGDSLMAMEIGIGNDKGKLAFIGTYL